eukprot:TRINITY_DN63578_c0_g2_i1.p2 TRINITY_DN63578_c0_g2~~TRINITY_DN63578_c0_g2_i1.p2  ORF type:complete len:115 (+),score=59.40 TRINITY_DN63578_c0_g2_i1:1-345(+)
MEKEKRKGVQESAVRVDIRQMTLEEMELYERKPATNPKRRTPAPASSWAAAEVMEEVMEESTHRSESPDTQDKTSRKKDKQEKKHKKERNDKKEKKHKKHKKEKKERKDTKSKK